MDIETRVSLMKQVGEEIITEQELRELLETKQHPIAYDGFEPSGRMHIAQGILRAINVNKMLKAGVKFHMLVADWFAYMNNKMAGDMEKIQKVGKYYIEVWKASGMDVDGVEFVWADELMKDRRHWETTVKIAKASTLNRILRCSQIMGRKSNETLSAAQIFYPCMQAADIFRIGCDITQLGMDQRKVNVLAREIGPKIGFWKPVVVSHHMLLGLSKPATKSADPDDLLLEMKMSKSRPDSAIFMDDSGDEIRRKVGKAYCPERRAELNPILEYCRYMIFEKIKAMRIERPKKFGGDIEIGSYAELERLYKEGGLHPMDLKNAVAFYLNEFLAPARRHFSSGKPKSLLEEVRGFGVTR